MMEEIASGPNVGALFEFLFYAGGMILLSAIVWGGVPALIVGGVVLIGYNAWVLFRPVIVPVAAALCVALNYAIRLGILFAAGYAVFRWFP